MLDRLISDLWPLSASFEYAAELGLALRMSRPGWFEQFERQLQFPPKLSQALGYRFLRFLEEREEDELPRRELQLALCGAVLACAPRVTAELEASHACLDRDYSPIVDPDEPPELDGQRIVLYAPEACHGYPDERGARLDAWTDVALEGAGVIRQPSEPASERQLARAHDVHFLRGLFSLPAGEVLTPETVITDRSRQAASAAAGALLWAARAAVADPAPVRICRVRPGSHHAERRRAGGTCLINNLAVAAVDALERDVHRVAIIDLDAHHGNGTEDIFREEGRVITFSIHQQPPFFPGTGSRTMVGRGPGRGANLNLPVSAEDDWLSFFEDGLRMVARKHPELVLVEFSADAHRADPVSDLQASDEDFFQAVKMIEGLGAPVVYELGASASERAWVGAVRSLVRAASDR